MTAENIIGHFGREEAAPVVNGERLRRSGGTVFGQSEAIAPSHVDRTADGCDEERVRH